MRERYIRRIDTSKYEVRGNTVYLNGKKILVLEKEHIYVNAMDSYISHEELEKLLPPCKLVLHGQFYFINGDCGLDIYVNYPGRWV